MLGSIFEQIKSRLEPNDRPHHIVNKILRQFQIELPPIPIGKIYRALPISEQISPRLTLEEKRYLGASKIGKLFLDHPSEKDLHEFACSLLCPLWLIEPIVCYSQRTEEELMEIFQVSKETILYQLWKLL